MDDMSNGVANTLKTAKKTCKNLTIVTIISLAVFLSVLTIFQTKYIYIAAAQQAFSDTHI
jgi:hypothetical protein